jgi:hypothetical protein
MWTEETTWKTPQWPGNYTLRAVADPEGWIEEYNETNNEKVAYILVEMVLPTPTPPKQGWITGPGEGDGSGGGFGDGTGTGTGTGNESGTGGETEINATNPIIKGIRDVIGYPFGTGGSTGGGGGGGSLYLYLILLLLLLITFFYLGYYKEKRAHAKQVFPGAYRRNRNKK